MTTEELQIIITAQINELSKKMDEAQKEVKGFEKKGSKALEAFNKTMAGCGKAAVAAGKAIATGLAAGVAALTGLAEGTRESRVATAKLETAFQAAGASAEQASETYSELYRFLGDGDVATEAANHLAKLTTNQEDLAEWTDICQGVYATFGDSLPIEGLTEAANETAKVGTLTGSLADALNWAGVNEEQFQAQLDACNTEAEREALIRETLNGLYSEASAAYEENAKSILDANEAQAKLASGLDALGAAAEPIITIFKVGLADALATILPHVQLITEGLTDMMSGIDGGSAKMQEGISGLINGVLTMITDLLPTLLEVGVNIITALIEGLVQAFPSIITTLVELLPTIIEALITLIPQITGAILEALPQILDALAKTVAAVIEGLAEMLPEVLAQIVAIIPQLIDTLIENIPVLLDAAITLLMAIVDAVPEIIPPLVEALPDLITKLTDTLLENIPVLLEAATELFTAIIDAIPEILPVLVEAIPDIISGIVDALIENYPTILKAGIDLFMEIVKAIPEIIPELIRGLGDIVSTVTTELVDKLLGILDFDWELPDLKLPSISVTWKDKPKWMAEAAEFLGLEGIPSFKINWNAVGGVFDKPTIFGYGSSLQGIGEAGAEAVVPLENNLGWLDKLATMLDQRMGGGRPIVLQVDGKTFAQISVDSLNQLAKQTGDLPLVLV